jgi:CBS domain-containing protein
VNNVITCERQENLSFVLKKLVEHRIHRLVIVKEEKGKKKVDGVVSVNDFLRFFTSHNQSI